MQAPYLITVRARSTPRVTVRSLQLSIMCTIQPQQNQPRSPLSRINRHLLKQIHRPNPPLLRNPESTRLRQNPLNHDYAGPFPKCWNQRVQDLHDVFIGEGMEDPAEVVGFR
jgi:hypothetical protein